jgi:hypothetical protein
VNAARCATRQNMRPAVRMIAGRFELVIFDCDGVLVDSEPIINRAHADVLTACGYPITERDLVERFCGMSDAEMLAIVEREWGHALPLSYAERVGVMIENEFCQSLAAIEGVAETLAALQLPVCVASSSAPEQIPSQARVDRPTRPFWGKITCSARRWSRAVSRRPTCFYMPRSVSKRRPSAVSSSKTALRASMPHSPPV